MEEDKLYCPKCGSSQLVANKKGFGAGKALTGAVLTGGIGLLAGFIGSGKVKVTCLKCGSKWDAGELRTTPLPTPKPRTLEEIHRDKEKENKDAIQGCGCLIAVIIIIVLSCMAS